MYGYWIRCDNCGHTEVIDRVPAPAPTHDYVQTEKSCDCDEWCSFSKIRTKDELETLKA